MPVNDELGMRMKEFYEGVPKTRLMRRTPVAIRIDGKAFHTFTRGFERPFDEVLIKAMQRTMKYLCENIQGCVLGYTQSDEITLILVDYKRLNSSAWFDYEVQKMCSIAASMATMAFNRFFREEIDNNTNLHPVKRNWHIAASLKGAMFDARVFNVPREEVRQLGLEIGLPEDLVLKTPSDGLCGQSDEDKLGFTYEQLDDYINEHWDKVPDDVCEKIKKLHMASRHKYKLIPTFWSYWLGE